MRMLVKLKSISDSNQLEPEADVKLARSAKAQPTPAYELTVDATTAPTSQ